MTTLFSAQEWNSMTGTVHADDLILISVDDHLVEPPDMFVGRLANAYTERAPRVIQRSDGREMWLFEGVEIPNFGLNAVSGRPQEEYGIEPTRISNPACWSHTRVPAVAERPSRLLTPGTPILVQSSSSTWSHSPTNCTMDTGTSK